MRGDAWNQLVSEPTGTDLEAALAEVRVRAVPIARRNARSRRAVSFIVGALTIGGAFWAGGLTAGSVRFADESELPVYNGAPVLKVGPALGAAVRNDSLLAYRVSTWTEWDGVRYDEGESFISGPPGTAFALWVGRDREQLEMLVRPKLTGDSVSYFVSSFRRRLVERGYEGLDLYGEGRAQVQQDVARGQALLIYPQGAGGAAPRTVIRIDGPDAGVPATLRWRGRPPLRTWNLESRFRNLGSDVSWRAGQAWLNGVKVGATREGGSIAIGLHFSPFPAMRFRLVDGTRYGYYTGQGGMQRVVIPGIADTLYVSAASGFGSEFCFTLRRLTAVRAAVDRSAGRPPFSATGCFTAIDRWGPTTLQSNQRQRLVAELIHAPPLYP